MHRNWKRMNKRGIVIEKRLHRIIFLTNILLTLQRHKTLRQLFQLFSEFWDRWYVSSLFPCVMSQLDSRRSLIINAIHIQHSHGHHRRWCNWKMWFAVRPRSLIEWLTVEFNYKKIPEIQGFNDSIKMHAVNSLKAFGYKYMIYWYFLKHYN